MKNAPTDYDKAREVRMIRAPGDWPKWPILPLKHRRRKFADEDSLGFLLASESPPYKVYVGLIYFIDSKAETWGEALRNFSTEDYTDIDALTEDWRVD